MLSSIKTFAKLLSIITFVCIGSLAQANPTQVVQPQDIVKLWSKAVQPFLLNPNDIATDVADHELNFKSNLNLSEQTQAIHVLKKVASTADQMRLDMWMNNPNINPDWLEMDAQQIKSLASQNKANDAKASNIENLLAAERTVSVLKILSRIQTPSANANALDKHHESCASAIANLKLEDQAIDVEILKILRLICAD